MLKTFKKTSPPYYNAQYCTGIASGINALRFALIAAGIGQGEILLNQAIRQKTGISLRYLTFSSLM